MIISWKTEKARRTVTASDTFSPLSGGRQKTVREMEMTQTAGAMMLMRK